jgi:hypothetical protein
MTDSRVRPATALMLALGMLIPARLPADGVSVTVGRYQAAGWGANLAETTLNTSNVNVSSFGKLFSYEVEGFVHAQPLIVSGIAIGGRSRNVLYVATMNNLLYALDADDPTVNGGVLWWIRLSDGGAFPVPATLDPLGPFGAASPPPGHEVVQGNWGILSTPTIDRGRNTVYILARTLESSGPVQRLHAIDLITGREKPGSPIVIAASVQVGDHTIRFDPKAASNRAGLVLANSNIVIAWAVSNKLEDKKYRGWVMAFDADTLHQTGVLSTAGSSATVGAGIWQSGRPPSVDGAGNIYYFVGNGWTLGTGVTGFGAACNPDQPVRPSAYLGESLIRLNTNGGLHLVGSWSPTDWCDLDLNDFDIGGSGPILINVSIAGSARTLAVGGGKGGALYVIDTALVSSPNIVAGNAKDGKPVPETPFVQGFCLVCDGEHHIMNGPVFWPRADTSGGPLLYVSTENDVIRTFRVANSANAGAPVVRTAPLSKSPDVIHGHPGAIMSLSANGEQSGSGILWATFASDNTGDFFTDASFSTKRGRLVAFDAENIGRALWSSDGVPARDGVGFFAKFNPPTIANGKVYVAAFPGPEPYIQSLDCEKATPDGKSCMTPVNQTYSAPNNMGQVVVYGLHPPAHPLVRSFSSEILPAVLNSSLH